MLRYNKLVRDQLFSVERSTPLSLSFNYGVNISKEIVPNVLAVIGDVFLSLPINPNALDARRCISYVFLFLPVSLVIVVAMLFFPFSKHCFYFFKHV